MRPRVPPVRRCCWQLVPESIRVAAATRAVTLLTGLLAMTVPAAILGVTGLSIEAQNAVLRRVDDIGARVVTVVSSGAEAVIPAAAVDRIARLSAVDWVVGLGPVFDVAGRQPAGAPTPARAYRSAGAPVVFSSLSGTSHSFDGTAGAFLSEASAQRAGVDGAYSILDPGAVPVVGWFRAGAPLSSLDAFALIPNDDDGLLLERIILAVNDPGWVEPVADNIGLMVGTDAAQTISVERSAALLEARAAVLDEVRRRDRALALALLGAAMVLGCAVVFAGTVAGRRDFGRRRALGATRAQLTALVVLATLWPALAGTAAGAIAGFVYLGSRLGHPPDWQYPVAIAILTTLALLVASALPAAMAATRDPLRVLRVP